MGNYIDTVSDALERLDDLGYERGGDDFANHGPMGAEALAVLGFCSEVPNWIDRYRRTMAHLDPPVPRWALDPGDETSWREALGAFDRAGDWEQLFRRLLSERPWTRCCRQLHRCFDRSAIGAVELDHHPTAHQAVRITELPCQIAHQLSSQCSHIASLPIWVSTRPTP